MARRIGGPGDGWAGDAGTQRHGRYSGGTYCDAGTLVVAAASALPVGETLTVGAGGTFIFDPTAATAPMAHGQATVVAAASAVPEPGTMLLLLAGLCGAAAYRRARRTNSGHGA